MHYTIFCSHKIFYLFFVILTGVTNLSEKKMNKIVALLRTSEFISYGHFEGCLCVKNFFKVFSNSCMDFVFNLLIYIAKTKHYLKMGWGGMYHRL